MPLLVHIFVVGPTCSPINLSNGEVTYTSSLVSGGYLPGTNATISCGEGLVTGGPKDIPGMETIMCLDSGEWS